MKRITLLKVVVFCLGIVAGAALTSMRANADERDQMTVFTFSGPVEIRARYWTRELTYSRYWTQSPTGT